MIAVFYHILMIVGHTILLDGFKMVDELLDHLLIVSIFFVHGTDGNFIFYNSYELLVELLMGHLEVLF